MNIYRSALAGLALLALAGCADFRAVVNSVGTVANADIINPVDDAQVTQLGNALGTANGAAVGYAALPLCPAGHGLTAGDWCHDKALLKTLDADMHLAVAAYQKLTTYQAAHPKGSTVVGGGFGALLSQAKGAVSTVKDLIAAYKIGGA